MQDPSPKPVDARPPDPLVRAGIIVIALIVLAVSVFVVYVSAIDAISTWLEYRWVPLARGVFAIAVAALCVWVLKRLTGFRAA